MAGEFVKKLQSLDLHPKLERTFAVRTKSGAALSIGAILIATVLFLSELSWYFQVDKVETMEVDPVRGARMRINFDVTFPDMPCAVVSMDAMDASGQHSLGLLHNLFKRRLDKDGNAIGVTEKGELKTIKSVEQLMKEKEKAIAEGRPTGGGASASVPAGTCGPCYGAGEVNECCNSCDDVRSAYRKKGWQFNMKGVEQCAREGFYGDVQAQLSAQEGCNLYGHVTVPKVAGNFHFAPGSGVSHAHSQVHDLLSFTVQAFNVSHRINSLSFGPYFPGHHSPLDGHSLHIEHGHGSGMKQYFLKLVPTLYRGLDDQTTDSFQYSVTEHLKPISPEVLAHQGEGDGHGHGHGGGGGAGPGVLPGVFFNYELSPIRMSIQEQRRSFLHFLTRVCAIVGGVFTVMGLLDSLVFRLQEDVLKGRGRGKKAGGSALLD